MEIFLSFDCEVIKKHESANIDLNPYLLMINY